MQTQKIFKAGNSAAVVIPAHILKEIGLKHGQSITVQSVPDTNSIVIKKAESKTRSDRSKSSASKKEFKDWLDIFMKENGEILDELAIR